MKIGNLVYEMVIEESMKSKEKFEEILKKWQVTYPNMTADDAVKILKRHDAIKNNITMDQPGVVSFLARYDGIPQGTKKYELKDLRDIFKFEIKHLVEFLTEFGNFSIDLGDVDNEESPESRLKRIFKEKAEQKTDEKVEESKKMWTDENTATVNENGFRVYEIKNQDQAVRMGYYYQEFHLENYKRKYINKEPNLRPPWCVTGRGGKVSEYIEYDAPDGTKRKDYLFSQYVNAYINYRKGQDRKFYFVIDENKTPTDRYYMSALQINRYGQFMVTSMMNDGDNAMSWDQIVNIYPKLEPYRSKIIFTQFSNEETSSDGDINDNLLNRINEDEGNLNDFCRLTKARKSEFINLGGTLSKPRSWSCMDSDLRRLYISTMSLDNATTKFSTFEFLSATLRVPGIQASLQKRLEDLGKKEGIMFLINHLFNYEFKIARRSVDNNQINIYESTRTKKFGIFSAIRLNWYEKNGIIFEPIYNLLPTEIYRDKEIGKTFMVEIYSDTNSPNEKSFYAAYDTNASNVKKSAHFFTYDAWNKLKETGKIVKQDESKRSGDIKNLEPDSDVDIKEIKKGI
jgi:hypothetical protein